MKNVAKNAGTKNNGATKENTSVFPAVQSSLELCHLLKAPALRLAVATGVTFVVLSAALSTVCAAPLASEDAPQVAVEATTDADVISALKEHSKTVNPIWDEDEKRVRQVDLNGATPEAIKLVGKLRGLQHLSVAVSDLRSEDFAPVAKLSELETLSVRQTPLDASIFRHLASLPALNTLFLTETSITSLKGLERLTGLVVLHIEICPLPAGQLAPVEKLTELRQLVFFQVGVSDCDLVHLQPLKKLDTLILSETKITNRGLPKLARMTWLDDLWVSETRVTEQGAEWLRQKLRHTHVLW